MSKLFFVHVPKCGGVAFETMLFASDLKYRRVNEDGLLERDLSGKAYGGHVHCSAIERADDSFVYVANIREPLSRAVSYYNYIIQRGSQDPQFERVSALTMEQFILDYIPRNEMLKFLTSEKMSMNFDEARRFIEDKYLYIGNVSSKKHDKDTSDFFEELVGEKMYLQGRVNEGKYPKGEDISVNAVKDFMRLNANDYKLYSWICEMGFYKSDKHLCAHITGINRNKI